MDFTKLVETRILRQILHTGPRRLCNIGIQGQLPSRNHGLQPFQLIQGTAPSLSNVEPS